MSVAAYITVLQAEKQKQIITFGNDMVLAGHTSKENPISERKMQEYFQHRSIPFLSQDEWKKIPFVIKGDQSSYWISEDQLKKYEMKTNEQSTILFVVCVIIILIPFYIFFFT